MSQAQKPNHSATIQAYIAGFSKHYPHHDVKVKTGKGKDGTTVFNVWIDGDKGDRPLSLQDLREATADFQR